MNIASTPFLFLFLPIATGLYFLIPRKKGLKLRNIFLAVISLFFYAWGEPVLIVLLVFMAVLTWLLGNMALGHKGTPKGKVAVALTVVLNLTVSVCLGKFYHIPIGFSFFLFFSISYVVDLYRSKNLEKPSLLNAILYTCSFFKILQGPIVSYRAFEKQIDERTESLDLFGEGVWRFAIGFCKKILIAGNLSFMVNHMVTSFSGGSTLPDAWLGAVAYLVYLYFDFSGYSDMAIGLGKIFGFSIPENFNYPYVSTSVAEFWRRFHITLCAWFTDYLYYPIILGPSVQLRKFLMRHNVNEKAAKTLQNIFVPACVWTATALWHGFNLNYLIWGLANCTAMLIEARIKPFANKTLNTALRRIGFLLFLFLSVPLISIGSFENTLAFYQAMFAGKWVFSAKALFFLQTYWPWLLIGVIGCFPLLPHLKKTIYEKLQPNWQKVWDIVSAVLLFSLVLLSIGYLFVIGSSGFLYQQ